MQSRHRASALVLAVLFSFSCRAQSPPLPQIIEEKDGNGTNVHVVGELAPTHQLDCVDIGRVPKDFTPPDIHTGVLACVQQGRSDEAAALFMLAGVRTRFDVERVSDVSVRDAGQVIAYRTVQRLTPNQKASFSAAMAPLAKGLSTQSALCETIAKTGPPDYVPYYLIWHGADFLTSRYSGSPDPAAGWLVPNFDADATWLRIQRDYLHCA